jgi:uncharacterized membrane protein/protein-disulfide isomerase
MMFNTRGTAVTRVAERYVRLLAIKITPDRIRNGIETNPDFPSLYCLSETFNRYHVDNNAYEVPAENIWQLEPPYVAYMNIPHVGKDFVLVSSVTDNSLSYFHQSRKSQKLTKEEFLKQYQQIVWIAQPNATSGDPAYKVRLKREKLMALRKKIWWGALCGLVLAGSAFHLNEGHPSSYWTAFILATAGMALAILLLAYEVDKDNPILQEICQTGGKMNCHAVLDSKYAMLKGFRWSEIGLFYFSAQWLWLWVPAVSPPFRDMAISFTALLASPYIIFSLIFQWRVIGQWCPLCLGVQAVLSAQLAWAAFHLPAGSLSLFNFPAAPQVILEMIGCVLAPIVGWYGLKPMIYKANNATDHAHAYTRLKLKTEVFHALLQQQTKVPDGWQGLGLTIGNPAAPISILKVCNPYCQPCARSHRHLKELLARNENVQVRIVFTAAMSGRAEATMVIRRLLSIAAQGNAARTRQALDDWYLDDSRDYERFAAKYPLDQQPEEPDTHLQNMYDWCKAADIAQTPTIFINGYKLPESYQTNELQQLL